ncbi:transporter substrate-binding domain-containing protein [Kordiimonas aestuarii]|uniref:transporter substrate-binding domain-containing protein n=1 Tax=Kordiimonas aestuarii TaxID=1005925 RepID=UPI0021CEC827|nr:transporter substrate-binding domain-containing protein [Kordiimonas aestuarii]
MHCFSVFAAMLLLAAALTPSVAIRAEYRQTDDSDSTSRQPSTINWYTHSFPPAFIGSGPFEGQGYQDEILSYFENRLTGFTIKRHQTALARVIASVRYGTAACAGALGRTPERERFMIFSRPILTSLPIRLVVGESDMARIDPYLDERGQISLATLARIDGMQGSAVKDRTYGAVLDPFVRRARERGLLHTAARPELAFLMLARGRVSYTFAYPDEVGYFMRLHAGKDQMNSLVTLPIAEEAGLVTSYIGCSNDSAGRAVIKAVDDILTAHGYEKTPPWQVPYLRWIDAAARSDLSRFMTISGKN